jgi:hypothetical protein
MSRRTVTHSVRSQQAAREVEAMLDGEKRLQDSYNSLSQHLRMHRQCRDENLEPTDGSIIHKLWQKGQLSRQQLMAWHRWFTDIRRAAGNTDKLSVSYQQRSDGTGSGGNDAAAYYGPLTNWNAEFSRIEQIWGRLRNHEKGLIEQLFRDAIRCSGLKEIHSHDLRYLGGMLSGYNDDRQKIAAGVSAIQRLLASLAEEYQIPHFYD